MGICGGAITITSGKDSAHRSASYGCPAREYRGTCSNDRRIPSDSLETQPLGKLKRDVLSSEAIDYVFERLEVELSKHVNRMDGDLETMRRREPKLEEELNNFARTIASGIDSPSLRQAITEREDEISAWTTKTLGAGRIASTRRFVTFGNSLRPISGVSASYFHTARTLFRCAWNSRSTSKK